MKSSTLIKPISTGAVAAVLMLAVYFIVLTLVSGWEFARTQFV